jgi:hypothetical protein
MLTAGSYCKRSRARLFPSTPLHPVSLTQIISGHSLPECQINILQEFLVNIDARFCHPRHSSSSLSRSKWRLYPVRFEVFTGYKNPLRTSQETHYVCATKPSRLILRKIWGFHGGDYEECRLLGYKNPPRTSQETHNVCATEPGRLMLGKIWGFHGADYEESRLLGYKNPVRTSPGTHNVCATEPGRLMLGKIWGFHGADYEECRLLGYKNPVRTSPGTHHVCATEPSRLMLRKIWGIHGGDYAESRFLGYKSKFVPHRKHITSLLQSPAG